MNAEKELEIALSQFGDYLQANGFALTADAKLWLREYVMKEEWKEQIFSQIKRKEKKTEDLVEGFRKLAAVASEIAFSEGRRTLTSQDVNKAVKKVFCRIWPFCK